MINYCLISTRQGIELQFSYSPDAPASMHVSAIDANTYDCDFIGGENDEWKCGISGTGADDAEALNDLVDQLEDAVAGSSWGTN